MRSADPGESTLWRGHLRACLVDATQSYGSNTMAADPDELLCVSIAPGVNDDWCVTNCARWSYHYNCPTTLCKCADDQQQQAATTGKTRLRDGKGSERSDDALNPATASAAAESSKLLR